MSKSLKYVVGVALILVAAIFTSPAMAAVDCDVNPELITSNRFNQNVRAYVYISGCDNPVNFDWNLSADGFEEDGNATLGNGRHQLAGRRWQLDEGAQVSLEIEGYGTLTSEMVGTWPVISRPEQVRDLEGACGAEVHGRNDPNVIVEIDGEEVFNDEITTRTWLIGPFWFPNTEIVKVEVWATNHDGTLRGHVEREFYNLCFEEPDGEKVVARIGFPSKEKNTLTACEILLVDEDLVGERFWFYWFSEDNEEELAEWSNVAGGKRHFGNIEQKNDGRVVASIFSHGHDLFAGLEADGSHEDNFYGIKIGGPWSPGDEFDFISNIYRGYDLVNYCPLLEKGPAPKDEEVKPYPFQCPNGELVLDVNKPIDDEESQFVLTYELDDEGNLVNEINITQQLEEVFGGPIEVLEAYFDPLNCKVAVTVRLLGSDDNWQIALVSARSGYVWNILTDGSTNMIAHGWFDENWFILFTEDGQLGVMNQHGNQRVDFTGAVADTAVVHPNDHQAVFSSNGMIHLIDIFTQETEQLLAGTPVAFDALGENLFYVDDERLWVWNLIQRNDPEPVNENVSDLAFDEDGQQNGVAMVNGNMHHSNPLVDLESLEMDRPEDVISDSPDWSDPFNRVDGVEIEINGVVVEDAEAETEEVIETSFDSMSLPDTEAEPTTYTVQSGDTMSSICDGMGSTNLYGEDGCIEKMKEANGGTSLIITDQVITLPSTPITS